MARSVSRPSRTGSDSTRGEALCSDSRGNGFSTTKSPSRSGIEPDCNVVRNMKAQIHSSTLRGPATSVNRRSDAPISPLRGMILQRPLNCRIGDANHLLIALQRTDAPEVIPDNQLDRVHSAIDAVNRGLKPNLSARGIVPAQISFGAEKQSMDRDISTLLIPILRDRRVLLEIVLI